MKYLFSFFAIVFFSIGFAASDEETTVDEATAKKLCGTYEITDEDNVRYSIKVKNDKTVVVEGNGRTYYGSWSKPWEKTGYGLIRFEFAGDDEDKPRIKFKGGTYWIANDYAIAEDGFLYGDAGGFGKPGRHDPQYRLKYRKTN
jgi:hypothetical protein